jgi:type IV pilus assembly protein PilB
MRNIREFETVLLRELTHKDIITAEQRANLVKEQTIKKVPILENIITSRLVDKELISEFLVKQFKARYIEEDEYISPTYDAVTDDLYNQFRVITQVVDERKAKIFFAGPVFNQGWDYISEKLDRPNIERVVIDYERFESMKQEIEDSITMRKQFAISTSRDLKNIGENQRAIRFVDEVLQKCIKLNASDIHVEPQKNSFRIRMRLNGVLQVFGEYELDFFPSFSSRIKLISNLNIAEKRNTQDGAIVYKFEDENEEVLDIPFRVSVMPIIYGEKIVLRKLGGKELTINLSNLGMGETILTPWKKIIKKPHGIILVSGPTGSGKSTTLQAAINEIKSDEINITTVEDPVEAKIVGINQVQIDAYKVSFADALRSILRQDPDVIMIGEIRDKETAEIALRASLTGHMVYSTIHTNDAPSSVTRLVDMGIEPFLVSSSVVAVLAQRLVRVLCNDCKEEDMTTSAEIDILGLDAPKKLCRPKGCLKCSNTGYISRVGVYELMLVDPHIQKLINNRASDVEIKEYAIDTLNMPTLFQEAKNKVLSGITSMHEFQKIISE